MIGNPDTLWLRQKLMLLKVYPSKISNYPVFRIFSLIHHK